MIMKRVATPCIVVLLLAVATGTSAQTAVYRHSFSTSAELPKAAGVWQIRGGRLHQSDVTERLAKINVPVPQSGEMQYAFDVRYEGGGIEDMMGGFGIHVFVDEAYDGRSWGNGNSYLLWLNYDPNASYGSKGFMAQIYRSYSPTGMELVAEYDLNAFARYLSTDNAKTIVRARIKVDAQTGSVWVEDPTLRGYGYRFDLGEPLGSGNYVSLRTNSLALSFDNIEITKLR